MGTKIKFFTIVLLSLVSASIFAQAKAKKKADKDTENFRYEIEAVQTGVQGTYLVKVWSFSKKPFVALEQSKKNAVHGIIFKGFAGITGVPGQNPLTDNPNLLEEKADFFTPFFAEGGGFLKYVGGTDELAIGAGDVIKIKKEYKIGVIISVNVAQLRKDLEKAGVIKSLSSGF